MAPPRLTIDREAVKAAAVEVAATEQIPSRSKVASRLGLVESTLNKRLREEGWTDAIDAILKREASPEPDVPGVKQNKDGSLTFATDPIPPNAPWRPEDVMRAHGADPDEHVIVRVRFNRWGNPAEPMAQLRFDAIPKASLFCPVNPNEWTPPPKPRKRKATKHRRIVICGDHHAPHHDKVLHRLFCEFLAEEKPDEGVLLGDLLDFSSISRHRERDGYAQSVNEGLRAAFGILRDYREASPDTRWTLLRGNHDDRMYHQIIDNARGLHNITPGGGVDANGDEDSRPSLSLRRLLYLDELGVDLVDEDWDRGKHKITRRFTARHGYTASKNSTEQMLSKLAHSTVQGHTHRLSVRYRTEHDDTDEDEPTSTRMAAEAGCMCEIDDGLGYSTDPDWQQGFLLAHAFDDDDFHVEQAIYVPGRILAPGGRRYVA